MAAKRDSLADILSCPVCLEEYEENGSHVPRMFPCNDTVCESCIKQLIKNNKLVCPECREEYQAPNKERSFFQNKYIMVQIRRKKKHKKETEKKENERCEKHGKERVIYCCQKTICISCLKEDHEGHKWVEIEVRENEALARKLTKVMKNLEEKVHMISETEKDVALRTEKCLKGLEEAKERIVKMINETKTQQNETNLRVDEEVEVMTAEINSLRDILESLRENKISRETVRGLIEDKSHSDHSDWSFCYQYPTFNVNGISVDEILGRIGKGDISLVLPACEDSGPDDDEQRPITRQIRNASQLRCTGLQLIFI